MAIGDSSYSNNGSNANGNNQNRNYDNTYYSRVSVKNDNNLAISISYRSGLMIIEIAEKKDGYKYESLEQIHLSPMKALLLTKEIDKFKEYLKTGDITIGKAFGVNAGMKDKVSYIGFHAGEDKKIYVTIGKFDDKGNIVEQATTHLNQNYNFALEWSNINTMEVTKEYNDEVELEMLQNAISDFALHMNGAIAYSVADLTRYDLNRTNGKFDAIFDKLGIERRSNGSGNYSRSNSFLNNASTGGATENHTSFDNIEDMIDD
jgi:hypothetical protein